MPLFQRRIVQKLLDENRLILPASVIEDHIRRLNKQDEESLTAEWEVLLIYSLAKIGSIEFERDHGGGRKPDITFSSDALGTFVADITTISDKNYDNENPVDYFYECIRNFFKKNGLLASGISVELESGMEGAEYGNRKVRVYLPPKQDITSFVKRNFKSIIDHVKTHPHKSYSERINDQNVIVDISYRPNHQFFSGGGYLAYQVPYSLHRNPIHNRLKRKAEQLKNSEFEGVMGVFICDGDCESLNDTMDSAEKCSQNDIIDKIFTNYSTLSFVVVFSVEEVSFHWGRESRRKIEGKFYNNPKARHLIMTDFSQKICEMCKFFPEPEVTPANAINHMKVKKNEGISFIGGWKLSGNKVHFSSRMMTEILAGNFDYKKHIQNEIKFDHNNRDMMSEFFNRQLREGRMIERVSIEKTKKDDDWIVFEYGESDPAISKFK